MSAVVPILPSARRSGSYPWVSDQSDGTYVNPILWSDYPDPDVIRDGADYYMVVSSFHCTPGLPILHSRDLVNWSIVNHAIEKLPTARFDRPQLGCGVWAPTIRRRGEKFWIFFPMPDEGIYCITADHPTARWSEPHLVRGGRGLIDPCPLWDDDGKAYLVHAYAGSRAGIKHKLRICPMAADGSALLGEGQIVFDDPQNHPTLEGPKFLKRDGYYYILAPAGGVATGWQLALRSRHIYGPYEAKVVLEQGSTDVNGPHQGALVDTPDGQWWFMHFQESQPYGRVPHLQPARWRNGWPLIGEDFDGNGVGEPVTQHRKPVSLDEVPRILVPSTTDRFDSPTLGLQWHWNANVDPQWYSLSRRPGWMRLFAQRASLDDLPRIPSVLLQKFPARSFVAETKVELQPRRNALDCGLAVLGRRSAALLVRGDDRGGQCLCELVDGQTVSTTPVPAGPVILRLDVADGGLCTFGYEIPGGQSAAGLFKFQASEGRWVGAKIGLLCVEEPGSLDGEPGHADFAYLRFSARSLRE